MIKNKPTQSLIGTLLLCLLSFMAAFELLIWRPFSHLLSYKPAFSSSRSVDSALGLPPFGSWAIGFIFSSITLMFIYSKRFWLIGWIGALAGLFVWTFFAYTALVTVAVDTQGAGGLMISTMFIFVSIEYFMIVAFVAHDRLTPKGHP